MFRRRRPPWWGRPFPVIGVLMGFYFAERQTRFISSRIHLEGVIDLGKKLYRKVQDSSR